MDNWQVLAADCLAWMRDQPDDSFDLVFGSPPYAEKGQRYIGGARKWDTVSWVSWMVEVTTEAVRLSRGYVMWVANGAVRGKRYLPACEGLLWELHKAGEVACERPCIWHKNAPPNRSDWFGNDWEYVLAFKSLGSQPYFDWKAVAQPPKYTAGGRFRQRTANGERRLGSEYPQSELARPRDVVRATVGGGHLGSKLAHDNEAPFPETLATHFVKACCPPKGIVLDPFVGSGTTMAAALKNGRSAVGIDFRESQVDLTRRRIVGMAIEND